MKKKYLNLINQLITELKTNPKVKEGFGAKFALQKLEVLAEYLEATPASDATHEALSVHFQALDAYTNSVLVDETDQDFGEIFCKLSLGRVYCKIIASKEFEYLAS